MNSFAIVGHYNLSLVTLSVLIAICASYAAVDLAACTAFADRRVRMACGAGGAISMGTGIWAMHYVGMLAFQLPIPVYYNLPIVGLSWLAAVASATVALLLVGRPKFGAPHLILGSLAMGAAIFAMHYIGMAAMRMPAHCLYDPRIVVLSGVIAVLVSSEALWITHKLRNDVGKFRWLRLICATLMGTAIAAMHYTGMAAAHFHAAAPVRLAASDVRLSPFAVEEIAGIVFAILFLAVSGVLATRYVSVQTELLRTMQREYRLLMDHNLASVCRTNLDGRVLEANQMALQTLGFQKREDIIGVNIADHYWHKEDRERIMHSLQQSGTVNGVEVCMKRTDGQPVWILYNLALEVNPATQQKEVIATAMDVSALKRTLEDLQQAKEAAEAANRAKSQFLANMSHELRTPLNGILGMTTLALYCDLSEEVRSYLEDSKLSASTLLSVINDVLDYSKIDAGQMRLVIKPFNPSQILEEAVRVVSGSALLKGLTLTLEVETALPSLVQGDSGRLRQVLLNVLGNAVKFTEQGSVCMRVQCRSQADGRSAFLIRIADTGMGIPANKLESIFEEFAQADVSDTRRFGGTGLGLAISSRLLSQMGGRISVESEFGKGSTFHIAVAFEPSTPEIVAAALAAQAPVPVDVPLSLSAAHSRH